MRGPSRRRVLGALSALAAAGVARPSIAGAPPPPRIVFLLIPNGLPDDVGWDAWVRATAAGCELGAITAPLAPVKDRCLFLDGVTMDVARVADTHVDGQMTVLTAGRPRGDTPGVPDRPSIDQRLAQLVGRNVTPEWPSLALAVQPDRAGMGSFSYLADGSPVPPLADPVRAYATVFGSNDGVGGSRLSRRRSVLDSVARDIARFRPRLPREDRLRAEAQADAIRTMELRVGAAENHTGMRCGGGAPVAMDPQDPQQFRAISRAQIDVLVAALACDVTRVATLLYRGALGGLPCRFAPVDSGSTLHMLSHHDLPTFLQAKRAHFEEVAYLATQLAAIPQNDGKTLLDHTLVVCLSETSVGHNYDRMPFVLIGGSSMGLRTGRCVRFDAPQPHRALLATLFALMNGPPDDAYFGGAGLAL